MKQLVSEYKYYIQGELNLSKNTCTSYLRDVHKYVDFLINTRKVNDVDEITLDDLRSYLASLKRQQMKATSQLRNLTAIRSFHRFLMLEKHTKHNVSKLVDSPRVEKRLPSILSIKEVELLLDSLPDETLIDIRNKAMIELTYSSGLRVGELLSLKTTDLHLDMGFVKVYGKGSKERIIPVGEIANDNLVRYLRDVRPILMKKTSNLLFLSPHGKAITRDVFSKALKSAALHAGIQKRVTPHKLRHSYASHLLEQGLDLRLIQELLGHEDISTTEIYTHVQNKTLTDIYLRAHPRSERNKP